VQRPPTAYLLPVVAPNGDSAFPLRQLATRYITPVGKGRAKNEHANHYSLRLLNEKHIVDLLIPPPWPQTTERKLKQIKKSTQAIRVEFAKLRPN
jgi:hypothetical protein